MAESPATWHVYIDHPATGLQVTGRAGPDGPVVTGTGFVARRRRKDRLPAPQHRGAVQAIVRKLTRALDGRSEGLIDIPVAMDGFSDFRRRVLEAARRIPGGQTVSYAGLAALAGSPGATRAAATVMRTNPFPIIVPCHRVVRSDGTIGGFMGRVSGHPIALKKRLLGREGATEF
jgi:methylated-DNA-[protein]-cysteine S-methyltransferase